MDKELQERVTLINQKLSQNIQLDRDDMETLFLIALLEEESHELTN